MLRIKKEGRFARCTRPTPYTLATGRFIRPSFKVEPRSGQECEGPRKSVFIQNTVRT
jgi:hypothetical protein